MRKLKRKGGRNIEFQNIEMIKKQEHQNLKRKESNEWVSTARNLITWQSIGRHFWQEINCSTQNLSTARIQLILAQPDLSSSGFEQLTKKVTNGRHC